MNIQDFRKEIVDTVAELRTEMDTADMLDHVDMIADGREEVIYYSRAWDFVAMIREYDWSLYADAKEMFQDNMLEHSDIDTMMAQMAYYIWTIALNEYIQK